MIIERSCSLNKNYLPRVKRKKGDGDMFLLLLLPFGAGVITRMTFYQQGQLFSRINVPWWALLGGWMLSILLAFIGLGELTNGNFSHAFALIFGVGVIGLLVPEIFQGIGSATKTSLSRPSNWLWILGVVVMLYALFVDPEIMGRIFLLVLVIFGIRIMIGGFKKKGK